MKREHWLDVCKGYLILLVVMGHVVSAFQSVDIYVDNYFFSFVHSFTYAFHMATFFFISGYIYDNFGNNRLTLGQKLIKRLITYGIPYVIFSFIYCIIKILLSSYTNTSVTFMDFVYIPIKPLGYLWFVYALMIMEMIQDLMTHMLEKEKINKKQGICLICVAVLLSIIQFYCSKNFGTNFTDFIISDFMRMWVYFLMGAYFGTSIVKLVLKLQWKTVLVIVVALVFCNILILARAVNKMWAVIFIMALFGIVISIFLSKKVNKSKVFEYLGRTCFPIYLLHDYILVLCRIIVVKSHMEYLWGVVFMGTSLLALILPIAIYIVSNKFFHLDFVYYPGKYLSIRRNRND